MNNFRLFCGFLIITLLTVTSPITAQASILSLIGKALGKSADNAAAGKTGAAALSADELSKASGLGKAIPDNVASMMLHTPGKTLADIPDIGAKTWLSKPVTTHLASDAEFLMRDYYLLLQGKPALGPAVSSKKAELKEIVNSSKAIQKHGKNTIPWYAVELLIRAAHLGYRLAEKELAEKCKNPAQFQIPETACKNQKR